jgi:hypothetical protein
VRRDPQPVGGILPVGGTEIRSELGAETWEQALDGAQARRSVHVCDEKEP